MEANPVKIWFQGFHSVATENSKLDQTCFNSLKRTPSSPNRSFGYQVHMLCHLATGDSCKVGPIVINKIIYFFLFFLLFKKMTTTKWRISTPETALIALTGSHVFIRPVYVDHTLQNRFFFLFSSDDKPCCWRWLYVPLAFVPRYLNRLHMLSEEESFHPRLPHLPRRQDQAVGDWKTTENRGGWANILQAGILTPLISLMELTNGL